MPETTVMTSDDIRRSLTRIAHQIIEKNGSTDHFYLAGIFTRGVPLAERLAGILSSLGCTGAQTAKLDIAPYRDDTPVEVKRRGENHTDDLACTDGKTIILVDDVLYTGRSVRAAMDALIDRGRPVSIQLAVLVDRGHRELPIKADYVGKNIPSARHEDIQVRLMETDRIDKVVVQRYVHKANDKIAGGTV